ncbi:aldo/keto reductase [Metabacillus herbersteinensis]|uniref:Aldo/keto reductase n=1 Tax=Metabacillus herbersteinensis TaxID=283816 RepID=A0ABV6GCV1_9BACI
MRKRQLGNSDLTVSEMGLGCMSLGTNEDHALSIIDEAIDRGINYLDTADLYDFGVNEELVGKAIKHRRNEIILATKVGNRWEEGKEGWHWDSSKAHIKEAVKKSLQRLQTDYIDLYQLHGGTVEDNIDETISAFEELMQEGTIRYYGISSIRPNVIKEFVNKSNIVSVMMQYSLLDRRPEELFPLLKEHGISVIVRGPLAKGLLTQKHLSDFNDKFKSNGFLSYSFEELKNLRETTYQTFPKQPLTQLALHYCLHDDVVSAVIPGASKTSQLLENLEAISGESLSKESYETLQNITKHEAYEQHRD